MRKAVPAVLAGALVMLVSSCPNSGEVIHLYGLDARVPNSMCIAPARPPGDGRIALEPAFPAVPEFSFERPVGLVQRPGDGTRFFLVQQTGSVVTFLPDGSSPTTFLDIAAKTTCCGERGLLGLAFHPDFASNGHVYANYTTSDPDLRTVVSRFTSSDGGLTADPATELELISVLQPYGNHNAGDLAFGNDGYLYITMGDGGAGGDPQGNGQNTNTLLGSILRIDVDGGSPYAIPADNPFVGGGGLPEIYAWGFRNPWRMSVDRATGEIWTGDVGQGRWEEISKVELGGNHGWKIREGMHCYSPNPCDPTGLTEPIVDYHHAEGNSVTGGYVYRGTAIPEIDGVYIYGDYGTGLVWGLFFDENNPEPDNRVLLETGKRIGAFGEGADGELYLVEYGPSGTVHKIVAGQSTPSEVPFPATLSETGCVDPADATQRADGVVPYEINVPFHSDGADKTRWLGIPDGQRIHVGADGDWDLPLGSVVVKNFRLDGELFETRLLVLHDDGGWAGYTYSWNAEGTDADWVPSGAVRAVGGLSWRYFKRSECRRCHTNAAGNSLGLTTRQLNKLVYYPSTQRVASQLRTLGYIGLLDALPDRVERLEAFPNLANTRVPLAERARTYLHVNCAHCHQPDGPGGGEWDLRVDTPLAETGICYTEPEEGDLDIEDARLLIPGDPDRSLILVRTALIDPDLRGEWMPDLGRATVDEDGVALLQEWIASLAPEECE